MKQKSNTERSEETAGRSSDQTGPPAPNGAPPGPDGETEPPQASTVIEPVVLDYLKHDTFETETEMRVSVYLKQIRNETLAISYESDSFSMVFGTR